MARARAEAKALAERTDISAQKKTLKAHKQGVCVQNPSLVYGIIALTHKAHLWFSGKFDPP